MQTLILIVFATGICLLSIFVWSVRKTEPVISWIIIFLIGLAPTLARVVFGWLACLITIGVVIVIIFRTPIIKSIKNWERRMRHLP